MNDVRIGNETNQTQKKWVEKAEGCLRKFIVSREQNVYGKAQSDNNVGTNWNNVIYNATKINTK